MLYVTAGMWESRCSFKTQPVNVSRPSAADGRLLNNFDDAVLSVESTWVYVMPQTRLGEGDEARGRNPKEQGRERLGRCGKRKTPPGFPIPKASGSPRRDNHLAHSWASARGQFDCPQLFLRNPWASTQGRRRGWLNERFSTVPTEDHRTT